MAVSAPPRRLPLAPDATPRNRPCLHIPLHDNHTAVTIAVMQQSVRLLFSERLSALCACTRPLTFFALTSSLDVPSPPRWLYGQVGSNRLFHAMLSMLGQFTVSVSHAMYHNARLMFIEKLALPHTFDFHGMWGTRLFSGSSVIIVFCHRC